MRHSAIASFFALGFSLEGQPPPSAKNILASVSMIESHQQIALQGQLRLNDVFFFFFKQKTAYEMVRSDWSSTCALPISLTRGRGYPRPRPEARRELRSRRPAAPP